jgi:hypothetical protein
MSGEAYHRCLAASFVHPLLVANLAGWYNEMRVPEYIVFQMHERPIAWFVLREHGYAELTPGDDGILRDEIFPGLWLDPAAFWAADMRRVLAVAQAGVASPEHAALVETLEQKLNPR